MTWWRDWMQVRQKLPIKKSALVPSPASVSVTARWTWVECHGYYGDEFSQIGRQLDDAQRWHGWPNCVPLVGIDGNWPLSRYSEAAGRSPISYWRWEQITDFAQLVAQPGWLWVADGFEAGTGDVETLIACLGTMHARGAILQCGHANGAQAERVRSAGFEVQAWASCSQISHVDLEDALRDLRPSRFVAQIEGPGERQATVEALQAGVFGSLPWDTVIAGWGGFQVL